MTAKEALKELVDDLSEEEASTWLARMRPEGSPEESEVTPHGRRGRSIDRPAALRLLREWQDEGPVTSEEDWKALREALDADRLSSRPLYP